MNSIWLALTYIKGLGTKKIKNIYEAFPDLQLADFQNGKIEHIIKIVKNKTIAETLYDFDLIQDYAKKAIQSVKFHQENEISVITIGDAWYPDLLKKLEDPPIVLYCKGNIELLQSNKNIAIVGTRNPTNKGKQMAKRIAQIFSEKDFTIVSGLALGIDTEAHIGTLDANGKTIAVLAGGLDTIYPKENLSLAEKIIEKDGLLISEKPIQSKMYSAAFVQRDRIQSGLSIAVCPIQTDIKGGTQNTIGFAKKQNRLLFCPVPMEDVPQTMGIKQLLEEGIIELRTTKDIPIILNHIAEKMNELTNGLSELPIENEPISKQLDLFN